jgi:transposase
VTTVSRELSISTATLERWRADALSRPARERAWTAPARFEAVLLTATMDEASKSAWCRERGVYPQELEQWRTAATRALADPEDSARTRHQEQKADRRRIKELERDLRRKEKALAEAAALLVLSKKLEAIFPKDKDEDA